MDIQKIWDEQKRYNELIRSEQPDTNWMPQYLLGMVSEVDEVLREINWKRHRIETSKVNPDNVARELADITKYVMSMWEFMGYSPEDMIQFVSEKNEMLEQLYLQENTLMPVGRRILIFDLDGTVADWRRTFSYWLQKDSPEYMHDPLDVSPHASSQFDTEHTIKYDKYFKAKEAFESSGMYAQILPYDDAVEAVRDARLEYDAYLICITARPVKKYKRLWLDTWNWLKLGDIQPDSLLFENEARILIANGLKDKNDVILWDDDPDLVIRAADAGLRVIMRKQSYNRHIVHSNVTIVDNFLGDDIFAQWRKE